MSASRTDSPADSKAHRLNRQALTERTGRYGQNCNGGRTGAVTSHGPCGEIRLELAVYLLGAIEPADRSVVDRHLADCAGCRDELAGLAGLPALLRRVSPQEASALAEDDASTSRRENLPSGPALRHLLTGAGRDRRRHVRTRVATAAAAGLVAGAGVITGWHLADPATQRPAASAPAWSVPARAGDPRTGVSATVRYAATAWGLQLSVQVTGIPVGTACELDVISRQGQVTTAGGWTIAGGRAIWYPASSPVALADVRGFVVASGSRILVNVPIKDRGEEPTTTRSWRS
jgi:Putative zinc-finger